MVTSEHWGFRVKRLREERGLTAAEFARRSGLSSSYVTKMEKGKSESPRDITINKMANALSMSPTALRQYLFGQLPPVRKESTLELLERAQSSLPLEINVYAHYPYAPGESVVTTFYLPKTEGLSKGVKGYVIHGSSLEPDYRDKEIIIVDHDISPVNGDEVVYLQDGEMEVGKYKKVGSNDYIESRGKTIRFEEAVSCAVVIGSYIMRRAQNLGLVAIAGLIGILGLLMVGLQMMT